MLDKMCEHLLNKALDGNKAAVQEARRQLEAGGSPTVESVAEALEAT
jgi:hypothetical protein